MGHADFHKGGDWNTICDRCGFKFKASELRKEWDGFMVCKTCWEPRQPQDYVRGVPDKQGVPWTRPEAPDTFQIVYAPIANFPLSVPLPRLFRDGMIVPVNQVSLDLPGVDVVFHQPPAKGVIVAWTGGWVNIVGMQTQVNQFAIGIGDGVNTNFQFSGP